MDQLRFFGEIMRWKIPKFNSGMKCGDFREKKSPHFLSPIISIPRIFTHIGMALNVLNENIYYNQIMVSGSDFYF